MSTAIQIPLRVEMAALAPPRLRPARFEDHEGIRRLASDHGLRFPAIEDWRHRWLANPLWERVGGRLPIGWVLETAGSEIVGSMESIPTLYKLRGRDLIAAASGLWCVRAPYRGFALQLIDEYFNQPVDLFMSTTVGPIAIATLSQFYAHVPLGEWDTMSYCVTQYPAFAKRALRKYHVPLAGLLAYPAGAGLWLKDAARSKPAAEHPRSVIIETTDRFDARFDAFWDELVRQNPERLLADRSGQTLWWHFGGAMRTGRLRIFTASKHRRLRAYCILKQESSTPGVRRMRLIDYQSIEQDVDLLPGLLQAALRRCVDENFYVLENVGVRVPKMRAFDQYAPYRKKLSNWVFFYGTADPALDAELRQPQFWDPSVFDGDASL